ncbi:hypothetical protein LZ32DRAFT_667180 [Colletotrichum eremochloae]|nr:hypothetical protein LZ32DRAFT_667180 [Colletotrichum eremochloae]
MSMLFPSHTFYNDFCPKCRKPWSSPLSVEMLCTKCGLSVRFLDSFDNKPDPVTSIALQDIQRTGLRVFFKETLLGLGAKSPKSMKNQSAINEQIMHTMIQEKKKELCPLPLTPDQHKTSEIKEFRRITLCNEQWPDIAKQRGLVDSSTNKLRTVTQGLRRHAEILNRQELVSVFACLVNSRMMGGRRTSEMTTFLRSIVDAFAGHQTLWVPPTSSLLSLQEYVSHARDARAQFHASPIRLRCFLWIYLETLQLYADLVHGCSDLLDYWAMPEGSAPEPTSLASSLFSALFCPHVIISRLTPDIVFDVADLFTERGPVQILACLPLLVRDASKLAVTHRFDGNLDTYFREARAPRDDAICELSQASRRWMETALQFRGQALADKSTIMMVDNAMSLAH